MSFPEALICVKVGKKIARSSWEIKDQFILKAGGYTVAEARPGSDYEKAGIKGEFRIAPHLDMKGGNGVCYPGWVPSQDDMFAEDWHVVQ